MFDYLYHMTTEDNLKNILKDMKLTAYKENAVFFGGSLEDCEALAPDGTGNKALKQYWDSFYFKVKDKPYYKKYFNWITVRPTFPVLKISKNEIGEVIRRKNLGHYEYLHFGDVILSETPEIIYINLPEHKELVLKPYDELVKVIKKCN